MRFFYALISLTLLFALAACGSPSPTEQATPSPMPEPLPTSDTGYPPPPQMPATPANDNSYPAPVIPQPPPSGYPAEGQVWMIRPAGLQCEEPLYPDMETAVSTLEDAGVTVLDSEEVELNVCLACNCPTSKHYRMLINSVDLEKAAALEWVQE